MANGVELNGNFIPMWLKTVMAFIDRVGFPIFAFIMMFYMAHVSLAKINVTQEKIVSALTEWQSSTVEFRKSMVGKTDMVLDNQRDIMNGLRK